MFAGVHRNPQVNVAPIPDARPLPVHLYCGKQSLAVALSDVVRRT